MSGITFPISSDIYGLIPTFSGMRFLLRYGVPYGYSFFENILFWRFMNGVYWVEIGKMSGRITTDSLIIVFGYD